MIYLIGGASRVGKSQIAEKIFLEKKVSYLPVDVLLVGLTKGAPSLGLGDNQTNIERGETVWPVVKGMIETFHQNAMDYLLEGDSLLPYYIAEMANTYKNEI